MEIVYAQTIDVRSKKPTLFGRLIMWWTGVNWHHCADVFTVKYGDGNIVSWVFDANFIYVMTDYSKWLEDYIVVNSCDTVKAFDLTQEDLQKIYYQAKSMIGSKYGVTSILGLLWHQVTGLVTIGVDGTKRLICSEASLRLYKDHLKKPIEEPFDYLDPRERGEYFPMKVVE